ncbi:MAG: DUF6456 domain-containing protein [Sulfitobacter sp.]|nr:DUF6456 domain-containing protein [Sulfitobacter sp.]
MTDRAHARGVSFQQLPGWVPEGALHYLAHVEQGKSIRALARQAGCHASTVLRQIRKIETRRDDPLVDAVLKKLGDIAPISTARRVKVRKPPVASTVPDEAALSRDAPRVLRRLCERGAVLAVAAEMEKAVVVRDTAQGGGTRTAVVDTSLAQAMALKEWIAPLGKGRIVRYQITAAGRAALEEMLQEERPGEGSDDQTDGVEDEGTGGNSPRKQRMRYAVTESPLVALSRHRDSKGDPFLSDAMVRAGERLREDFELAQMDEVAGIEVGPAGRAHALEARGRVAAAMTDLGPGLSDVVLRCCCYLEGLEMTEKRLGWSARSGKVVLRIALIRLQRHYEQTIGLAGPMIG